MRKVRGLLLVLGLGVLFVAVVVGLSILLYQPSDVHNRWYTEGYRDGYQEGRSTVMNTPLGSLRVYPETFGWESWGEGLVE